MHYIIVTEYESPGETTCKVKGLSSSDANTLETYLMEHQLPCNNMREFFEVDISGDQVLNLLGNSNYNYRVICQSMAIENTAIGGRTVKIQKLVWTMGKIEENII